jgi:prolyl-tRNA editing enzyme YbaK/EbsC (Cys-tRNA(Pro) deacylase)
MAARSIDRVREALIAAGQDETIRAFPEGTRSAVDAARAVGCSVAQIVKSLVFRAGEDPVLILMSGSNRVDLTKASHVLGLRLEAADGTWVRKTTGFAIGGVAPIGHERSPRVLIDEDLMSLSTLWAAAGSPNHVFAIEPAALQQITGGHVADIKQQGEPAANDQVRP